MTDAARLLQDALDGVGEPPEELQACVGLADRLRASATASVLEDDVRVAVRLRLAAEMSAASARPSRVSRGVSPRRRFVSIVAVALAMSTSTVALASTDTSVGRQLRKAARTLRLLPGESPRRAERDERTLPAATSADRAATAALVRRVRAQVAQTVEEANLLLSPSPTATTAPTDEATEFPAPQTPEAPGPEAPDSVSPAPAEAPIDEVPADEDSGSPPADPPSQGDDAVDNPVDVPADGDTPVESIDESATAEAGSDASNTKARSWGDEESAQNVLPPDAA